MRVVVVVVLAYVDFSGLVKKSGRDMLLSCMLPYYLVSKGRDVRAWLTMLADLVSVFRTLYLCYCTCVRK